jgi:hypothetical protein
MPPDPDIEDTESAPEPSEQEQLDRRADELLRLAYEREGVDIFAAGEPEKMAFDKKAAERLVRVRLAYYPDEARDRLLVTNSGRYWVLNGGYMAFLKEDPPTGGGGTRGRNPEMEALRFTYMKLRLSTFWLSLGMSIVGFVISIVSLGIALYFREFPLR